MAFFQKKPQTSSSAPLYTLGLNTTVLIVGLGNTGKQYELTRHNMGFMCLDNFADTHEFPVWINKSDLKGQMTQQALGNVRVLLFKPTTMMNHSGEAVQAACHFFRIEPSRVIVVYDELDIPFGQIRMRTGGGTAGHNGLKSLVTHIGDDFGRVRIGIGPKKPDGINGADFVLGKLDKSGQAQLPNLYKEINSILTEYIYRNELQPETRSFIL